MFGEPQLVYPKYKLQLNLKLQHVKESMYTTMVLQMLHP